MPPDQAARLVAFVEKLPVYEQHETWTETIGWTFEEVTHLIYLRELVERGRLRPG